MPTRPRLLLALALLASTCAAAQPSFAQKAGRKEQTPTDTDSKRENKDNDKPVTAADVHNPVLWRKPADIASLDLYEGAGGTKHIPKAPFSFEKEAMGGTNPKFDVRDAGDTRWRVKLGEEPRPEVVSSRFLWAMGYFVNEDYVLPTADIKGLQLKRKPKDLTGETITDARFARKPGGQNKIGIWKWKDNPFMNTREFNGLRVMMAVLNDWDLKDVNNAVYDDTKTGEQLYLVSDVGATFATNSLRRTREQDKGNVSSYEDSKFIVKQDAKTVSFGTPAPPKGLLVAAADLPTGEYFHRRGFDWIGKDVPLVDARWIGGMLGQLSHQQIVDAFRAGHFPDADAATYVKIVEARIAELKAL